MIPGGEPEVADLPALHPGEAATPSPQESPRCSSPGTCVASLTTFPGKEVSAVLLCEQRPVLSLASQFVLAKFGHRVPGTSPTQGLC